ncbi:PREDICTED: charged multivesicular body protein 6 [Cyphomyrmex costatus]|uniref:Charged multivesicular body protein 6 n=1 Tax=Cyphomyrmex costatus TaxID=456900 RepID=A0A195CKE9_9HYME|nr:PREDICTED: charged multivesicular body protein 6 [Cyphomyrmex costatus]KYN01196.1 Charged multivesicular body protein 6 [Cyphomyrmex costatus]
MGIFFAKKKPSRVTEQDKAILQVKQSMDKIKQYQKKLEESMEKERLLAKELSKMGKKDRALLLLCKKKYQEQIMNRLYHQVESLHRLIMDLEFAKIEMKVVDGLKTGNTALKQLNTLMCIDDIEKILCETREGIEKQNEIAEILTSTIATEEKIDEREIEAELDALMEADINEKAPDIPKDVLLSDVPKDVLLPDVPKELPEEEKSRTKEKIQVMQ